MVAGITPWRGGIKRSPRWPLHGFPTVSARGKRHAAMSGNAAALTSLQLAPRERSVGPSRSAASIRRDRPDLEIASQIGTLGWQLFPIAISLAPPHGAGRARSPPDAPLGSARVPRSTGPGSGHPQTDDACPNIKEPSESLTKPESRFQAIRSGARSAMSGNIVFALGIRHHEIRTGEFQ